MTSWCTSRR